MSSRLGFSPSTARISCEAKLHLLSLSLSPALSFSLSLSVFVLPLLSDITRSHDDPEKFPHLPKHNFSMEPVATRMQSRSTTTMDAQTMGWSAQLHNGRETEVTHYKDNPN